MKPILLAVLAVTTAPVSGQTFRGDVATGKTLFAGRCSSCHSAEPGAPSEIGPALAGVGGRKAASLPDYDYSAALKKLGVVWTSATLDRFLQNPQAAAPGTRMPVAVADPKQRAAIVAYLLSLKAK